MSNAKAKVVFVLDGIDITIQCLNQDKIKDICQKYAYKIEKNINTLLFLYGGKYLNFELSFNDQANSIDKKNHEMKVLVYKNENQVIKNDNKAISGKLNKIERINKEVYNKNKENILKYLDNFGGQQLREIISKELYYLNELEKNFGFLSTIGVKLLLKHNYNEIEGFIRAPDNSPYKNGIFKFFLTIPENYPISNPQLKLINIFHTEVNYNSHCCMYLLNVWKKEYDLSLILISLYEFFFCNNSHGYLNEAESLYKKSINEFEQKCQELTNKNASHIFDDKFEYLFLDYYDTEKEFDESTYLFYDIENHISKNIAIYGIIKYEILEKMFGRKMNSRETILITGNKIYFHLNNYKELLDNHIIFIAPNFVLKQNANDYKFN